MPAIAQYPTAWAQMSDLAAAAKRRGLSFEEFWAGAVRPGRPPITWRVPEGKRPDGAVVWANDTQTRKDDQAAVNQTRDGWERAYLRAPQLKREEALPRLLSLFDRAATLRAAEAVTEDRGPTGGEAVLSAA